MRATAVASEPSAERGALRALEQAGTCADALIAGFLAAAAERPSVLFSPVQILIAGPGSGSRALDGRCRQPGLGTKRPRGVQQGESVPLAALIAVPGSLGVLSLLHAHDAHLAFDKLAAPAAARALSLGAPQRSALLARLGRLGASALSDPQVARPLLSVAGPPEGGLLTEQDLAEVRPEGAAPHEAALSPKFDAMLVPWPVRAGTHRRSEIVAVLDARGVLAALAYAPDDDGAPVPDLEITMPRAAVVVRRGVPRTRPGEPLECPAPIALIATEGRPFLALGVAAKQKLRPEVLTRAAAGEPLVATAWLEAAREASRGTAAFGVVRPSSGNEPRRIVLEEAG